MCWSDDGDPGCAGVMRVTQDVLDVLLAVHVKEILERQWSRKKGYVMEWKC